MKGAAFTAQALKAVIVSWIRATNRSAVDTWTKKNWIFVANVEVASDLFFFLGNIILLPFYTTRHKSLKQTQRY